MEQDSVSVSASLLGTRHFGANLATGAERIASISSVDLSSLGSILRRPHDVAAADL